MMRNGSWIGLGRLDVLMMHYGSFSKRNEENSQQKL